MSGAADDDAYGDACLSLLNHWKECDARELEALTARSANTTLRPAFLVPDQSDGIVLLLPPVRLEDLQCSWHLGRYLFVPALLFGTAEDNMAVFLHDLHVDDVAAILASECAQAKAQLGPGYPDSVRWWSRAEGRG